MGGWWYQLQGGGEGGGESLYYYVQSIHVCHIRVYTCVDMYMYCICYIPQTKID